MIGPIREEYCCAALLMPAISWPQGVSWVHLLPLLAGQSSLALLFLHYLIMDIGKNPVSEGFGMAGITAHSD